MLKLEPILVNSICSPIRNLIPEVPGLYLIRTPRGVYVGSTNNLRKRFTNHRGYCVNLSKKGVKTIQEDYQNDPNSVIFEVLQYISVENLRKYEQILVNLLKPFHNTHVIDVTSPLGTSRSVESRLKMSATKSKLYAGEGNPMFGKSHSDETKAKIAKSHLGKKRGPQSEETIAKRVAATRYTKLTKQSTYVH